MTALDIAGIKNIVIVQNKIDLVSEKNAIKNYDQILNFIKGTCAEGAPIIPISAHQDVNIDVLIKDYQEDLLKGRIIHIDFYEIEKGKLLKTRVPVHLEGTAIGVKEGGVLEHLLHEIDVECLPKDLPKSFQIDISDLKAHHSIHIKDIEAIEGVKILNPLDQVVCLIEVKAAVEEEVEEVEEEAALEEEEAEEAEEEKDQETTEE